MLASTGICPGCSFCFYGKGRLLRLYFTSSFKYSLQWGHEKYENVTNSIRCRVVLVTFSLRKAAGSPIHAESCLSLLNPLLDFVVKSRHRTREGHGHVWFRLLCTPVYDCRGPCAMQTVKTSIDVEFSVKYMVFNRTGRSLALAGDSGLMLVDLVPQLSSTSDAPASATICRCLAMQLNHVP